jgi:hypothetical protein
LQEQQLLDLARTVVRQSQPASRPTLDRTVICPVCGKVGGGPYLKYAKKKADGSSYKYPAIFHQETGTWHTLSKKFLSNKVQELGLRVAPESQPQPAAPRATAKARRGPAEGPGTPARQEKAATIAATAPAPPSLSLESAVAKFGGFPLESELLDSGIGKETIESAVRDGNLLRATTALSKKVVCALPDAQLKGLDPKKMPFALESRFRSRMNK